MIRHIVALRFAQSTSQATRDQIYRDLSGLRDHIDGILDFQHRTNTSPEDDMVRGFRDLFWFDFRDADARDAYLPHPEHLAVGARLVAALEGGKDGVFVMDFEV